MGLQEIAADLAVGQYPLVTHFYVDADPADPNLAEDISAAKPKVQSLESITHFLTLPSIAPRMSQRHQDPIMDFTKSIILTSDEYIEAAAKLRQAKEDAAKEKQRQWEEKEEQQKRKAAEREEERIQQEARAAEIAEARVVKARQREEERIQKEEAWVLRQHASTQQAKERARKCTECLEAQRLQVMQTAERAMGQQTSRLQAEGTLVVFRPAFGMPSTTNTPVPATSLSPNYQRPQHFQFEQNFVTPLHSALPSTPPRTLLYAFPATHYGTPICPQTLQSWSSGAQTGPSSSVQVEGAIAPTWQLGTGSHAQQLEQH